MFTYWDQRLYLSQWFPNGGARLIHATQFQCFGTVTNPLVIMSTVPTFIIHIFLSPWAKI